jgi:hypothetical protein
MVWVASGPPWLDMLPFYRLPSSPTAFFDAIQTCTFSALLLSRLLYIHSYPHVCPDSVGVQYESDVIRALSSLTGRVTGSYDLANGGSLILQR